MELAVGEDGAVLDVRFPRLDTPEPESLRRRALGWSFRPALYDGRPQKVRFEIGGDGKAIAPPTGGGAPVGIGEGIAAPVPSPRVELPEGTSAPAKPARLRLTIDAAGDVTEVVLQSSCGDDALDARAVEAARKMTFTPAHRTRPGNNEPEPVAVYLDVEARFVEASAPPGR